MRRIGDERALARKRLRQAIEHAVECVREHLHLGALAARVVDPRPQVARVHARHDRCHPPQRPRDPRGDEERGQQRARECEHAREHERARHALLRVRHRRQRLAHADHRVLTSRQCERALEQPQVPHVREQLCRVAVVHAEQPRRGAVLQDLRTRALPAVRRAVRKQLRTIRRRARARN